MDPGDSKGEYVEPRRRSTRHMHKIAMYTVDVRPRIAQKRKKEVENRFLPAAVNGSKEQESTSAIYGVDVRPRNAQKRRREVENNPLPTIVNRTKEQGSTSAKDEGKPLKKGLNVFLKFDLLLHRSRYSEIGSPSKIGRLQQAGDVGDDYENGETKVPEEMEVVDHADHVQEDDIFEAVMKNQDQDLSSEDERENCEAVMKKKPLIEEESIIRTLQARNLEMEEHKMLWKIAHQESQNPSLPKVIGYQNARCDPQSSLKEASRESSVSISNWPLEDRHEVLTARSSIRQCWEKMEEKDVSTTELPRWNRYQCKEGYKTPMQQRKKLSPTNQQLYHRKAESKKTVITKARSTKGSVCRVLQWALFLLVSLGLGLVGYQHFPPSTAEHQDKMAPSLTLETQLAALKFIFPNQRSELWKRTEVHLKRHLSIAQPSEPVSMILTSGRGAEKTLACLAQQLAAAFSTALNASVLNIDGVSKTTQDSDQVKLDIDRALKEAFEGGKRSAVIHRFEELPPGATLIFYRYCDHENAAFKKIFLTFTVLLPVYELNSDLTLSAVEEMVHEYVKEKFVSSDRPATFNQMDVDKLSGLWSRISHVILPVAAEHTIEQHGCRE